VVNKRHTSPYPTPEHQSLMYCIPRTGRTAQFADKLKQWIKDTQALVLALPPCTWDEILQIRTANYPGPREALGPLDKVKQKFDLWGDIPRTILFKERGFHKPLDHELSSMSLAAAMQYISTYGLDHDHHSGRIFHLHPFSNRRKRSRLSSTAT
jgi:hypothetical protein